MWERAPASPAPEPLDTPSDDVPVVDLSAHGGRSDADAAIPAWMEGLNDRQAEAVLHGRGPLLVVAGAGSGKTKTLACRVARLIDEGVAAERILLLTFTRRAAGEMLQRASALLGGRAADRVFGGTFHSVANRLLRTYGRAVGLRDGFTVVDQGDASDLFGSIRADGGFGSTGIRFPKQETIAALYSRMVNAQQRLPDVLDRHFPWCKEHEDDLKQIIRSYTEQKKDLGVVDYDDLLLYWRALLESATGPTVCHAFDHVLVDEYQDTNAVQADILRLLVGDHGNVTVVGDDAQAIYGFRAASAGNMLGFADTFAGTTVVKLEQNYRSTPSILETANAVMDQAAGVLPKKLWSARPDGPQPALVTCVDEAAQSAYVCESILDLREQGLALRDQAVLFRTGHHSDGLELELARRDIPYVKFGGLRFLEAAHVKDLLALLRILDNPRDDLAWRRVLLTLAGVGPVTAGRLLDHLSRDGIDLRLSSLLEHGLPVPATAERAAAELRAALADCAGIDGRVPDPRVQIERLRDFCRLTFERSYDDAVARLGDIDQLAVVAGSYPDRSRFLTELVLDPPSGTADLAGSPHLDDDYLTLSTIHSAKGCEWRAVFVIHAADGNIPSDMALGEPGGVDEERRLLYVALTRARDHLWVTVPQRFYHRRFGYDAAHHYAPPSRFITAAADHFEKLTASASPATNRAEAVPDGPDPVERLLGSLLA